MTNSKINTIRLSAVISVHNEEKQLATCLQTLSFADEIVVLLDKCSDDSEIIAKRYTNRIFEVVKKIKKDPGLIMFSIVNQDNKNKLQHLFDKERLEYISVLDPILDNLKTIFNLDVSIITFNL